MIDLIFKNLIRRKMRTGLTIFGIALGIFAMTVMGGMSEYMTDFTDNSMNMMANHIQVQPDGSFGGVGRLEESKVNEVRRVPGVAKAYGVLMTSIDPEEVGALGAGSFVFGTQPDFQVETELISGRYLMPGDSYVTVLGSGVARKFKLKVGDELLIKSRRIKGKSSSISYIRNFTVIGILENTGTIFDNSAQIPLRTVQKFYGMENKISYVYAKPLPDADPEELAKRIEISMEGVISNSPNELREQIKSQIAIFTLITISAAILAAIIGGLSVMNTMLMSVSERTKEIGIMKALGAEKRTIIFMTMGEAALMGIIGGILGLITGGFLANFLNNTFEDSQGTTLFLITPRLIIIVLSFAIILGTLCGIYPAYRAAKMSPMEALRYE